jgi:hypothetical protein
MGDAREMNDHAGRPLRVKSGHVGAGRTAEEKIRAYSCKNIAAKFPPVLRFLGWKDPCQKPGTVAVEIRGRMEALVTSEKDARRMFGACSRRRGKW